MTNEVLAHARAGDEDAFLERTDPYRRELQIHIYRIVGSARWHDGLAQAGIAITSDERTLIVAEPSAERLTAFEIDDDRGLRARRVCAEP